MTNTHSPGEIPVCESAGSSVLCVDLDGTLISTDILWESVLLLLRQRPLLALLLPGWLLQGKAVLKRRLAESVSIDVARLPYRRDVLAFLREEARTGRPVVLATAADQFVARGIASHLGVFTDVIASDGTTNLTGRRKAAALTSRFGLGRFAYAEHRRLGDRASVVAASVRAARPHQWVKNLLLFVPLITSHRFFDVALATRALTAFAAFSLCASAIYIVNDLLDIQNDREHPRKRLRPLASGELGIGIAIVLALSLLVAAFTIGLLFVSVEFSWMLALYLALTSAYSLRLKRLPILDVLLLAALYAFRVLAGGVAVGIAISEWLLPFAMFLFLSLAMMKRFSELQVSSKSALASRGYDVGDANLLQAAGISSGYLAVLVLALYISSDDVSSLYRSPQSLWAICGLLLLWVTRMWFRAQRGDISDDPVVAAAKDRWTYVVGVTGLLVLLVAI